ncbi:class I SAM-dependent methyltransferase [Paracoccaceae bacterium]|nr:class I SAM-dependent methyltransferase [Paracoccaceae bacterium]
MKLIRMLKLLISSPKEFILKVKSKITDTLDWLKYSQNEKLLQQEKMYKALGFDRPKAIAKLRKLSLPDKEQHILFSAISLHSKISSILEIGTFNGSSSKVLSSLFPEAKILTIDLHDEDPLFISTYRRSGDQARKQFISERNNLLKSCPNVTFEQKNSLCLSLDVFEFDLIWVDGAHGYPVVTADIINALRLAKNQGWILCDDMFMGLQNSDSYYKSNATYETIAALEYAGLVKYSKVYKRLNFQSSGRRSCSEFICVASKV